MKKTSKTRRSSKEAAIDNRLAKAVTERTQMILDLLQQLARNVAVSEREQRKFRTAIVSRVAKIETTVRMTYGAQIAEAHGCSDSGGMRKHAANSEEFIAKASDKLATAMMNFIYGESSETSLRHGEKRQWSVGK